MTSKPTYPAHFVGIDPGHNAGAITVLTMTGELHACAHWKRMKRKAGDVWRVELEHAYQKSIMSFHDNLYHALDSIWGRITLGNYLLTVEQPFIPHRGLRGLVHLIESAGVCLGMWGPGAHSIHRVSANVWRRDVLNLPARTKATDAEAKAIEHASACIAGSTLQHVGHVAEATCMAQWLILEQGHRALRPA